MLAWEVFNSPQALSAAELDRLHALLCNFGPVPLLHVAPHVDMTPGTVESSGTQRWRGCLSRTGNNGIAWNIDLDCWLTLCQAADHLHRLSLNS